MESPKNQEKVLESFKQGPNILENALVDLSDIELDYVPSNGGWSIRQIIHHVVDGDDLWKIGIKMALGGEEAEFTLKWYMALPQIEWAKRWSYEKRSIDISLTLFRAIRSHILQLLEYSPNGWNKSVQIRNPKGEIEVVPVGFVIQMQTDHVEHHVKRILEIRKEISST
jgi:hypothetical protein